MRKDGHNFEAILGSTVRPRVKNRKVVFLRSHFLKVTERFFFFLSCPEVYVNISSDYLKDILMMSL